MQPEASVRERLARGAAVKSVANDRMAEARQVHANLMAAAGLRRDRQQRKFADAADRLDHSARGAARAFRIRTRRIANDHLALVLRMMRDRRVDPGLALDEAGDERFVAPRDSS